MPAHLTAAVTFPQPMKRALITGITGQDGSYLAEFLLARGYQVHGIRRSAASAPPALASAPAADGPGAPSDLILHHGDLTDGSNLLRIVQQVQPDEIYNLAAQSSVALSFEMPAYTADVDAMGTLRLLEAVRLLGLGGRTRFFQAGTSELYGDAAPAGQAGPPVFQPRNPYAVAKLFAYWITVNYREAHGMYACNGILFNHESPRRGESFVTRKITRGLCRLAQGLAQGCLRLGNLDARRDWGHARDYVKMQWLMLQQERPEDYDIATGEQHTVRDFVAWAAAELGISLQFVGQGLDERGVVLSVQGDRAPAVRPGQCLVAVHPQHFRPVEPAILPRQASRARERLGWVPEVSARQLCAEMVAQDLAAAIREARPRAGMRVPDGQRQ